MSDDADTRAHWERVYRTKSPAEVSWYQSLPATSLELLGQLGLSPSLAVIDVGGGASTFVDALIDRGLSEITVLDISRAALDHAKARLGERGAPVTWIEADITKTKLGEGAYDVWHDRAVFHFLTHAGDRRCYAEAVARALRTGGVAVIATFSPSGPPRCSGLDVMRYDAEGIARELGREFALEHSLDEEHRTPSGNTQAFTYAVLRRR